MAFPPYKHFCHGENKNRNPFRNIWTRETARIKHRQYTVKQFIENPPHTGSSDVVTTGGGYEIEKSIIIGARADLVR